jgi:hypothetical protein
MNPSTDAATLVAPEEKRLLANVTLGIVLNLQERGE